MKEKIKLYNGEVFLFLIALLFVVLGVGMWRFFVLVKPPYPIEYQEKAFSIPKLEQKRVFVASKNGTKYYPVDCSSAKSIKIENQIFFTSILEAEQAGFTRTSQCK